MNKENEKKIEMEDLLRIIGTKEVQIDVMRGTIVGLTEELTRVQGQLKDVLEKNKVV